MSLQHGPFSSTLFSVQIMHFVRKRQLHVSLPPAHASAASFPTGLHAPAPLIDDPSARDLLLLVPLPLLLGPPRPLLRLARLHLTPPRRLGLFLLRARLELGDLLRRQLRRARRGPVTLTAVAVFAA